MTDLVDYIEIKSNEFGWKFSYGNTANQNLIQSELNTEEIYLLLDPVNRQKQFSEFGATTSINFSGRFVLLVQSDLDNTYHNQDEEQRFLNRVLGLSGGFTVDNECIEVPVKLGKYTKNIKPLLTEIEKLEGEINCSDYNLVRWRVLDAINLFDTNLDGIIVEYSITEQNP